MKSTEKSISTGRYSSVSQKKAEGAIYTPKALADFVTLNLVNTATKISEAHPLRILDPAVGNGELLVSLFKQIILQYPQLEIEVYGFEPNLEALAIAKSRIKSLSPSTILHLQSENFLDFVLARAGASKQDSPLNQKKKLPQTYDLIIANPPYVRTQIIGARKAQQLSKQFNLSGRVDLYHAFLVAIVQMLKPDGVAGIIVSNRFMTTHSGVSVRQLLFKECNICHIWDFGDTKLFDAAVLPAVLIVQGKNGHQTVQPAFTSIYETSQPQEKQASTPIQALSHTGVVQVADGRCFLVNHGQLNVCGASGEVWRITNKTTDQWLATVQSNTWGVFRDIGKIRVGVKTCADKVFIRADWQDFPEAERPELLRPLATHHIARRFKPLVPKPPRQILYPHEITQDRRCAVDLSRYPRSKSYLESHRFALEGRKYLAKAKRQWYEIWIPQDPAAWEQPKLVFRDIAKEPMFWIDQSGSVVNGDCYWIACEDLKQMDLLWLAAGVANSQFIEQFYDYKFHNKLYSGRRRYMTQYVEQFPLPDPDFDLSQSIIAKAKKVYQLTPSAKADQLQQEIEQMVWTAFGLNAEEVSG